MHMPQRIQHLQHSGSSGARCRRGGDTIGGQVSLQQPSVRFGEGQCLLEGGQGGEEPRGAAGQRHRVERRGRPIAMHGWRIIQHDGCRYMQLLPAEIQARLPYRWFRQNGTSLKLLDMVRGWDVDVQEKDSMTRGIFGFIWSE